MGNTTTEVKVAGRGGVPIDAKAVAVNVTMINPAKDGFATVYPCGEPVPLASTVNFTAGSIVPNAAMVKIGAGGAICVLSNVDTDVILDVNGYDAAQAVAQSFEPTRVLETRPGLTTFDHLFETQAPRPADSVFELQIGGRLGIPTAIRAAVLNITVTDADRARVRHGLPVWRRETGRLDPQLRTRHDRGQPRRCHDHDRRQGVHLHPNGNATSSSTSAATTPDPCRRRNPASVSAP